MHPTKLLTKYEKNYISKFFSLIAGVVDTADKHFFANLFIYSSYISSLFYTEDGKKR